MSICKVNKVTNTNESEARIEMFLVYCETVELTKSFWCRPVGDFKRMKLRNGKCACQLQTWCEERRASRSRLTWVNGRGMWRNWTGQVGWLSGWKKFVRDGGDLEVDSPLNWEPVNGCEGLGCTGVALLTGNDAHQSIMKFRAPSILTTHNYII